MAGRLPPHYLYGMHRYYDMEEDEEDLEQKIEQIMRFLDTRFLQPATEAPSCTPATSVEPMATGQSSESGSASQSQDGAQPAPGTLNQSQSQSSVSDVTTTLANQLSITTVTQSDGSQSSAASGSGSNKPGAVASTSGQSSLPNVIATDIEPEDPQKATSGGVSPKRKAEAESLSVSLAGVDITGGPPDAKEARRSSPGGGGGEPDPGPSGQAVMQEGGDGPGGQGQAAEPPAAQAEEEKRPDVDELVKLFNRHRPRPISPNRVQRLMQLPREVVREIREEMQYADMYRMMGGRRRSRGRGDRRQQPREPNSDEDSDEESLRLQARFPQPDQQAKFQVTDAQKLLRLLILGGVNMARGHQADPTHNQDFNVITRMIDEGLGAQVVALLKDVSVKGRSSKQDSLIYGLAKCCRSKDMDTKKASYEAVQEMCRTPTQIFQLINYIEGMDKDSTGWGRGLRRAICKWYNSNSNNPMRLAMHVTKYQQRHGWSHRDVFRLSHIKPVDDAIGFIVRYAVKDMKEAESHFLKEEGYLGRDKLEKVHKYLKAVEEAKSSMDVERTKQLIQEHQLVREQLRTEMLNEPTIWATLLKDMPLTALTRNLGKMSSLQLFDTPEYRDLAVSKLTNTVAMKKARVHPFKLLLAHHVYKKGKGEKGSLTWTPNPEIVDALERAFYGSFETVEATGKRILIALDISGSMTSLLMDSPIEVREAATLMAMVTYRAETNCDIVGFHTKLVPLEMFKDRNKKLEQLVNETHQLGFGATDCSKPMVWARKHRKEYDAFIIYTDSETNSHRVPPYAALDKYRRVMNIPNAKLIVVGMTASNFTIAKPDDLHMLDVVGFDTDTPDMIREFLVGGLE